MASVMPKNIYSVIGDTISLNSTNGALSVASFLTLNSTITNLNLTSTTITNILATNISSSTFIGPNTTITNAVHTSLSTGTLNLTTLTTSSLLATTSISSSSIQGTNSTITNSVHTALSTGTLNLTSAIASTGITTGTLLATTSISSSSIQGSNSTITNMVNTALSTGTLNLTSVIASNGITTGTLLATTSISTGQLLSVNLSTATINSTSSTVGTLNVTGLSSVQNITATNETLAVLIATTGITTGTLLATTSISTGQLNSINLSTATINSTSSTVGTLNVTGLSSVQNITATNETLAVLIATTGITTGTLLATTSVSTGQLNSTNTTTGTLNIITGITTPSLLVTGQITSGQLASANISTNNLYVNTLITGSNLGVTNLTTGTLRSTSTRGILVGSSTDIDAGRLISAHNNTLASGGQTYITLGVGASTNNQSEFSFAYFTSGSTLNRTSIGLFGNPNMLNILGTGNIGVGNTNPSYKLDVSGDIRATSNIYLGGGYIYPNTNITSASNLFLNVYSGTLSINGPTTLLGYGINAAGTSTLGNIVSIGSGNVGIGVATPSSLFHVGAAVDGIYGNNALASNTINILGAARTSPTYSGTTDMNGTLFINSTSAYGRNVGASISLGGRGNNFGGGNMHMTFARMNGVQANDRDTYDGNFVIEVNTGGSLYERLRIMANGNIGIGTNSPSQLLDISGNLTLSNAGSSKMFLGNTTTGAARLNIRDFSTNLIEFQFSTNTIGNINCFSNGSGLLLKAGGTNQFVLSSNGNIGIETTSPSFKLDVNGDFRAYGGRYIIQNSQDGGTGRGIYMWAENDPNWAIYMGQSGASKSFNGGSAPTGVYGFASHAIRFRVFNNSASPSNGWIFENSGEGHVASIRSDGHMYVAGNLGLGVVSPGYKLHTAGDIYADGGWLRVSGDRGLYFESHGRGIWPAVSGDYGNVETYGEGKNSWEGYSIAGRYVFMSADNNSCGIYNDVDNYWLTYWDRPNNIYRIGHDGARDVQVCGGNGLFYVGGNRSGAFMRLNDDLYFSDPQNGTIEIKNGGNNNWGTLVGYFNNQCSRESKKNIVKFEEPELNTLYNDTINTDVYTFHYKDDADTDKKKIGIILEESPDYMCVTPDGKSLYNLSYITMLHGAIKVLDKKVKDLEAENSTLKSQIQQIFQHLGLN